MAGKPIKISILADASAATQSLQRFAGDTESAAGRVGTSMDSATEGVRKKSQEMGDGFDRARESADELDTKAMGFRDTMTGVEDSMKGVGMIAKGDLFTGFLTLGMGVGDLASGFANFLIPAFKNGITWIKNLTVVQRILNITMLTNPVFLVIAAIVALVAIFVIAYKKSETFRRIVDGLWGAFKNAFSRIPGIVSGAVSRVMSFLGSLPGRIKGVFSSAGSWLSSAGRAIVTGLWNGISGLAGWLKDKVAGLAGWLPGWVKSRLGIASPSKVFAKIGEQSAEGIGVGWQRRMTGLRAQIRGGAVSLADSARNGAQGGTSGSSVAAGDLAIRDNVTRAIVREVRKVVRVDPNGLGVTA